MRTKEEKQYLWKEILRQLGGNKFKVMTGAKNFVGGENGIGFKFGRNASKSNYVCIDLNSMDTYDVTFKHIRKFEAIEDKTFNGIYCDQLDGIFSSYTGMATRLF